MRLKPSLFLFLLMYVCNMAFTVLKQESDWALLFNNSDLRGWDKYLGPALDSTGKKINDIPVGLNNDPQQVFSVIKLNGENAIRVSGEGFGAISTEKEYGNYHLQLKFKWGNLTWGQKKRRKKDSGLLYHSVGSYGADYGAWMRSQEFQIEETNCGDYWGVAGGIEDIKASKKSDSEYVYDPAGKLTTFSATGSTGRHCIKAGNAENPTGEWNTLDLYCYKDTSVHVINGKVMMVLVNSRQSDNGKETPLTKGKIQLQSEGAEVFYKQIRIKNINSIPAELLK